MASAGALDFDGALSAIDYLIYTFHMPLFFFISGMFINHSLQNGLSSFTRSRLATIAYPYFVWSIVQGGVQIALSGTASTNGDMEPARLLAILWAPISPFWFLYALFFASLTVAMTRRWIGVPYLAGVAAAYIAAELLLPAVVAEIAYGTLYVAAGCYARALRVSRPALTLAVSVPLLLGSVTACLYVGIPYKLAIPAAAFGIAAVLSGGALLGKRSIFSLIGRCSMTILLTHLIWLGGTRLIMINGLGIESPVALLAIGTVAAILASLAIQRAADLAGLSRYLGLPVVFGGRIKAGGHAASSVPEHGWHPQARTHPLARP